MNQIKITKQEFKATEDSGYYGLRFEVSIDLLVNGEAKNMYLDHHIGHEEILRQMTVEIAMNPREYAWFEVYKVFKSEIPVVKKVLSRTVGGYRGLDFTTDELAILALISRDHPAQVIWKQLASKVQEGIEDHFQQEAPELKGWMDLFTYVSPSTISR